MMLYGPAGTGKTIMCQAAAYEAKAELIIGTLKMIYYKNLSVLYLLKVIFVYEAHSILTRSQIGIYIQHVKAPQRIIKIV